MKYYSFVIPFAIKNDTVKRSKRFSNDTWRENVRLQPQLVSVYFFAHTYHHEDVRECSNIDRFNDCRNISKVRRVALEEGSTFETRRIQDNFQEFLQESYASWRGTFVTFRAYRSFHGSRNANFSFSLSPFLSPWQQIDFHINESISSSKSWSYNRLLEPLRHATPANRDDWEKKVSISSGKRILPTIVAFSVIIVWKRMVINIVDTRR